MSAVIIPFPTSMKLPTAKEINLRIAKARAIFGVGESSSRCAYVSGYMDGFMERQAQKTLGSTAKR